MLPRVTPVALLVTPVTYCGNNFEIACCGKLLIHFSADPPVYHSGVSYRRLKYRRNNFSYYDILLILNY